MAATTVRDSSLFRPTVDPIVFLPITGITDTATGLYAIEERNGEWWACRRPGEWSPVSREAGWQVAPHPLGRQEGMYLHRTRPARR